MTPLLIALAVLVGTFMQMVTSARDTGRAHKAAVDWMNAEDALVAGEPLRRRRRTRRELRSWRDPATRRGVRHVNTVLASWVVLTMAAGAAVAVAVRDLVA